MVTWTRRHIKSGADWIKIHATGRIPGHAGELPVWTEDELRVVCDTAHDLDTPVSAHCRDATSTLAGRSGGCRPDPARLVHGRGRARGRRRLRCVACARPSRSWPTWPTTATSVGAGVGMTGHLPRRDRGHRRDDAPGLRRRACRCCAARSPASPSPPTGTGTPARWRCSSTCSTSTPLEAITCATANGAIAMRRTGRARCGRAREAWPTCSSSTAIRRPDVTVLADRRQPAARSSAGAGRSTSTARGPSGAPCPTSASPSGPTTVLTRERGRVRRTDAGRRGMSEATRVCWSREAAAGLGAVHRCRGRGRRLPGRPVDVDADARAADRRDASTERSGWSAPPTTPPPSRLRSTRSGPRTCSSTTPASCASGRWSIWPRTTGGRRSTST